MLERYPDEAKKKAVKPREFWIEEETDYYAAQITCLKQCAGLDALHVIEYSAYKRLRDAIEKVNSMTALDFSENAEFILHEALNATPSSTATGDEK